MCWQFLLCFCAGTSLLLCAYRIATEYVFHHRKLGNEEQYLCRTDMLAFGRQRDGASDSDASAFCVCFYIRRIPCGGLTFTILPSTITDR